MSEQLNTSVVQVHVLVTIGPIPMEYATLSKRCLDYFFRVALDATTMVWLIHFSS